MPAAPVSIPASQPGFNGSHGFFPSEFNRVRPEKSLKVIGRVAPMGHKLPTHQNIRWQGALRFRVQALDTKSDVRPVSPGYPMQPIRNTATGAMAA